VTVSESITLTLSAEQFEQLFEAVAERLREAVGPENQISMTWPEWMDVKTAARYIGTEVGAIRKLVERRKIAYSQEAPGCRVWIARRDLDAFMEANRIRPRGGGA
jgi:excisionase family DNA binding protein